ncbi:phosphatase 2C-like domain-containing protein, partial [Baffinella frigidus]
GWSAIPHPLKADRGGEDVHLVCRAGGTTMFGVFDGVGGWAELGVDPAEYARKLAQELEEQLQRDPTIATWQERPLLSMLEVAFERMEQDELPGSCTVCLAMLTATGQLHVLNIGDSGLHVVRDGVSVFQTNEQQHYFNCPFQLGMGSDDSPGDADYYVLEDLAEGDLIVCATDGVWDNVRPQPETRNPKPENLKPFFK